MIHAGLARVEGGPDGFSGINLGTAALESKGRRQGRQRPASLVG